MNDKVLDVIKNTFRDFDAQLRYSKTHPFDMKFLKQNIKEGLFTNRVTNINGVRCLIRKSNLIDNCYRYKDYINSMLSDKKVRDFYNYLVKKNHRMKVYRAVHDNFETKYRPSSFVVGQSEIMKIPFSTTTDLEFAKYWSEGYACCIYEIQIDFKSFKRFYSDRKLDYIPFIYIDEEQREFTLGPGLLKVKRISRVDGFKMYHMKYEPFPIMNEEWNEKLYKDCQELKKTF
jgi:hypothetical protein